MSQYGFKIKSFKKRNRQKREFVGFIGAGEGIRTLDFNLGKVKIRLLFLIEFVDF